MSDLFDGEGEVNWPFVMDRLGTGQVVEIPCDNEREFVRRAKQVAKRAEKRNLGIEVIRGEHSLRVEPRAGTVPASAAPERGAETREERQRLRAQREVLRAERGVERGNDG